MNDTNDILSTCNQYEEVLHCLLEKHAPIKQRTITIRPEEAWYNSSIKEEKRLRRQLARKWHWSKILSDRTAYVNQCKAVNKLIYESKQAYYHNLITENSTNSKLLFKTANRLLQKNIDL